MKIAHFLRPVMSLLIGLTMVSAGGLTAYADPTADPRTAARAIDVRQLAPSGVLRAAFSGMRGITAVRLTSGKALNWPSWRQVVVLEATPSLSDQQVKRVVRETARRLDRVPQNLHSTFTVLFEFEPGFQVELNPISLAIDADMVLGLEQLLHWRSDTRVLSAEASDRGYTLTTAPADAGTLTLDLVAGPTSKPSALRNGTVPFEVRSTDGTFRITTGRFANPTAVRQLIAAFTRWPGTAVRYGTDQGLVEFSPDAISLDQVIGGEPALDSREFSRLQLGWGVARADARDFASLFGPGAARSLLSAVQGVPGVLWVRPSLDVVGALEVVCNTPVCWREVSVIGDRLVSDGTLSLRPQVSLLPETPAPLDDWRAVPAFSAWPSDSAAQLSAYNTLIKIPGITILDLHQSSRERPILAINPAISRRDLITTLSTVARLPQQQPIEISVGTSAAIIWDIGLLSPQGLRRDESLDVMVEGKLVDPGLVKRIEQIWDQVRPGNR